MKQERLYQIILAPVVSEKSTVVADKSDQMVIKVLPDANKKEIAEAVEFMFKVKVRSVQVMNVRGKVKKTGRIKGKTSDWKKAYVCLEKGQDFDFQGMGQS